MISQKTVLNTQTKINSWHEEWGGGGACLSIYFLPSTQRCIVSRGRADSGMAAGVGTVRSLSYQNCLKAVNEIIK